MAHTDMTLVTGAAGFAGGHLLDHLRRLAGGARIVAWNRPGGAPPVPAPTVEWRAVDLTDRRAVAVALDESSPSRVFHLAGAPNVAASWKSVVGHLRANVMGAHNLLDALRIRERPCRVLIVTSAQIYRASDDPIDESAPLGPQNPYGLSKLAEDQLALRAAAEGPAEVIVARPFNHAGPRQGAAFAIASFARQIARIEAGLAEPELRVGNLNTRRDITDVRDVVEAYARLMTGGTPGRAYNICSGRAWRMRDLLDELLALSNTAIRVQVDENQLRPNDTPIVQGDASRIRTDVGWVPSIRVEQTLRDTLAWWRAQVRQTTESG